MNLVLTVALAAALALPAAAQETQTAAAPSEAGGETAVATPVADTEGDAAPAPALVPLDATEITLDQFLWTQRPIVVFADTPADPRFQQQMEYLASRPEGLIERGAVLITDTDPAARSALRTKLRPRGFMLVLIAKDGTVNLRKPFPWKVREIEHAIDKWPLRQQELRDRSAVGG